MLVAAVLRPEEGEDGELEMVRVATEQLSDSPRFSVGETECAVERLIGEFRQDNGEYSLQYDFQLKRGV